MTARVWAHRVGNFRSSAASGWSHVIRFNGLSDLIEGLKKAALRDQIEVLAIVAHGDAGGLVQLDKDLTPSTISEFGANLTDLSAYLTTHAKLIFISCVAAQGEEGTKLLILISKYLSNRSVIGFTISGAVAQEGLPTAPGQVVEAEHYMRGSSAALLRGLPILTEYSHFSKWARNGVITKLPYQEQVKRPNYRCAWHTCPGHARPTDRCQPALKGTSRRLRYPG